MKFLLILSIAALGLAGCATSHQNFIPMSTGTVRDIDIRCATFGSGTDVADVTRRVIELLHKDPAGFEARVSALGIDPAPYKAKCLIIDYYRNGKAYRFAVVNQQHVSYELLLKNAKQ